MKYWLETLGCPKNQVDSDKLGGLLESEGYGPALEPAEADLIVVNTCAFIESARQESIDTILGLDDLRAGGARLVVTGCLAERYGEELAAALPEADLVAGFGIPLTVPRPGAGTAPASSAAAPRASGPADVPVVLGPKPTPDRASGPPAPGPVQRSLLPVDPLPLRAGSGRARPLPSFDLLNLPRPAAQAPWAYLKVAEGCNRACGFCAIPSFRGRQRSRELPDLLAEVDALQAQEIVLVAQDLASYGTDLGRRGAIVELVGAVAGRVPRTRLLYLYPSQLDDSLIEVMGDTSCPYFDLSLQHVSRRHLRRMGRWGDGDRFLERVALIRARYPDATFRSSFILGYPGETEDDHDELLRFLEEAELDWAGFFPFSPEEGTRAARQPHPVDAALALERQAECSELQDQITARRRQDLVGTLATVLVDRPGVGRSHREAPEIDGLVRIPDDLEVGSFIEVEITGAVGTDLEAVPAGSRSSSRSGTVTRGPAGGPYGRS